MDATLDQHLAWCGSCARRLDAMAHDLDRWHHVAAEHADALFDEPRMAAQRRGIQRRLGALPAARVLPFPAPGTERHAPIARIAAAVLLVAMAGAAVVRVLEMPGRVNTATSIRAAAARSAAPVRVVRETPADADALEDIDLALVRPRTAVAELRALDEFTPHVRDIVAQRR
jgi:hypothetical protein